MVLWSNEGDSVGKADAWQNGHRSIQALPGDVDYGPIAG
jgi:hypothetical protein